MGKQWKQCQMLFCWAPKSLQMVTGDMKLKGACSLEKSYDQPRQHIKKQRHYFANKGPSSKAMVFPVVIYGCESWTIKKAEHWRIDAFELWCWRRLLRVPWTAKDQTSQSCRKSVLTIHWKDWCWSWSYNILATWYEEPNHWKRPWCWERLTVKGEGGSDEMVEMVRWYHQLNGHEFEQTLGNSEGQGSLACCSPWECKELDMPERLNNNNIADYTDYSCQDMPDDSKNANLWFNGTKFIFYSSTLWLSRAVVIYRVTE